MPATSFSSTTPRDYQNVADDKASFSSGESTINETEQPDKADTRLLSGHRDSDRVGPPTLSTGLSAVARRLSLLLEDEQPIAEASATRHNHKEKEPPVTWVSLPQKSQLAVLTFARLSEPLAERSLSAYMFYQLRWFDKDAPSSKIAYQGGFLTAAFAAAQFLTAVWWGRAADTPWIGRKRVLLVGLFGTMLSCLGIGFAKSFAQALFFRALAGALNGNVGVMRTMISEIIKEKKFQSRAFLLMPMCFNVGVVIGPILGGFLADPIESFPGVFGPGSPVGGKTGVGWMASFPYALPNIVSGFFITMSAFGIIFFLEETHVALRNRPDYGRKLGRVIARAVCRGRNSYKYTQLLAETPIDDEGIDLEETPQTPSAPEPKAKAPDTNPPPLRQILTRNVTFTLLAHHLLALHVSTFNALIFLLLPAPTSTNKNAHLPFLFTGGLGLSTEKVGLATAIIGLIGLPLQLSLYPRVSEKMGTLRSYKAFLPFSIAAYALLPYLTLLPSTSLPSWALWPFLTVILTLQVISRTFALPSAVILVNNSSPSPTALGTIHGFAQSISSGGRTAGPVLGGWILGWGLGNNCVGAVWWGMAIVAAANWCLLWTVFEGDGRGGEA